MSHSPRRFAFVPASLAAFGAFAATAALPAKAQDAPTAPVPTTTPATPAPPNPPSTSPQAPAPPQTAGGPVSPSPQTGTFPALPFTLKTDITVRYDATNFTSLQTGLIPTDDQGTFRARVRLFFIAPLTYQADAVLGVSSGTNASPTVPFFVLGDADRGKPFSLARAYFTYYLGKTISPATPAILFGKMDNPFWRAQVGQNTPASGLPNFVLPNFSSDIVWDNDVTPEGVAVRIPITPFGKNKSQRIRLTNTTAYYQIEIPAQTTFTGITTETYEIASQFHLDAGALQLGLGYYDYHNLNSGLYAPYFQPGFGIDPGTGTSSFLLRDNTGLQTTNGHYGYSSTVFAFGKDRWKVINPTVQLLSPYQFSHSNIKQFAVFEYLDNTSADYESKGKGIAIGINRGTNHRDDFAAWLQLRDVDSDATLATFADSDLGAGTDYKGYQIGAIYHPQDNLAIRALYDDYKGYPEKTNHVDRFFFDVVKLF